MAGAPGAKDGEKTISDMFRSDAYGAETLDILKQLAAAVTSPPKSDAKVEDLLGDFGLVDDGAGAGQMRRLQRERTPDRMGEKQETVAIATKESAVTDSPERAAVAGLQNLIKEAFITPQAAQAEEIAQAQGVTAEEHGVEAAKEGEEGKELAANQQEFDLFQLG
jgi:hypothetical protein